MGEGSFDAGLFVGELERLGGRGRREVLAFEQIDSTSSELVREMRSGSGAGTFAVADEQSEGRGRLGRSWCSPAGGSLYASLIVELAADAATLVSLAAGVAAVDALERTGSPRPSLKWPNDLMLEGRKLGGILCEAPLPSDRPGALVVGIGLNLASAAFPPELEELAVALDDLGRDAPRRETLAAGWVFELERRVAELSEAGSAADLVRAWRERAEPFGRRVRVGRIEGRTAALDDEGRLLLEKDDGGTIAVVGGMVENVES
jgi:BirA family transcriptional regulator, biotin operon repressor / biotin---[acetyl-CoA-carboxylase] ligase